MLGTKPSLTIVRRIKATPAKVYAALTEPAKMMRWWGPDAGPTLSAEADVRPGGRLSVVPERESLVTLSLRPLNGGTELTLIHEQFHDEANGERHV